LLKTTPSADGEDVADAIRILDDVINQYQSPVLSLRELVAAMRVSLNTHHRGTKLRSAGEWSVVAWKNSSPAVEVTWGGRMAFVCREPALQLYFLIMYA
jgi:hypothetical protein